MTDRNEQTLYVPFIYQVENHQWAVMVRTGPGQFDWLSALLPKRLAAKRMRQIRQEIYETWCKR